MPGGEKNFPTPRKKKVPDPRTTINRFRLCAVDGGEKKIVDMSVVARGRDEGGELVEENKEDKEDKDGDAVVKRDAEWSDRDDGGEGDEADEAGGAADESKDGDENDTVLVARHWSLGDDGESKDKCGDGGSGPCVTEGATEQKQKTIGRAARDRAFRASRVAQLSLLSQHSSCSSFISRAASHSTVPTSDACVLRPMSNDDWDLGASSSSPLSAHSMHHSWFPVPPPTTSASHSPSRAPSSVPLDVTVDRPDALDGLPMRRSETTKPATQFEYDTPVLRRTRHMLRPAYYAGALLHSMEYRALYEAAIGDFVGRAPYRDVYFSVCRAARDGHDWLLCVTKRANNLKTYYGIYYLGDGAGHASPVLGSVNACVGVHWAAAAAGAQHAPTILCLLDAPDHYALAGSNSAGSDHTISYVPFDAPERVRECLEALATPVPAPVIDTVLLFLDRLDALAFALGPPARQLAYCQACAAGTGAVYVELLRRCVDCRHVFCARHYEGERKRCGECYEQLTEQRCVDGVCAECGKGARDCPVCGVCAACHSCDADDPCERTCAECTYGDAPIRECCHCCSTCCECDPYEHVQKDVDPTVYSAEDSFVVVSEAKHGPHDDTKGAGVDDSDEKKLASRMVRHAHTVELEGDDADRRTGSGATTYMHENGDANAGDGGDDGERIDMDASDD